MHPSLSTLERRGKPAHLQPAFESLLRARRALESAALSFQLPSPFTSGSPGPHQFGVTIAESAAEHCSAAALVEMRYAARGYCVDSLAPETSSPPYESQQDITLIATERTQTVGTLTLRLDGPAGLLAEESYLQEIQAVRAAGGKVCELTRLAVASEVNFRSVFPGLFSLAYLAGRVLHQVTDLFIEVNPRHVGFYRRLLGFAIAAGTRICPRVMAPSVLLRLDLAELEEKLEMLACRVEPAPQPN